MIPLLAIDSGSPVRYGLHEGNRRPSGLRSTLRMTGRYYFTVALCCFTVATPALAQNFGSSIAASVSKKLPWKLEASIEEEYRTRNSLSTSDRFSTTLDLSWKPLKYLKLGADYQPIYFNHEKKGWELRNRYAFYAIGNYNFHGVTIALREKFQSTHRVGVQATNSRANPKLFLRSRVKVSYKQKSFKVVPSVAVEFYKPINDPQDNAMNKVKYTAGAEYDFNKKHAVELFYRYTNFVDDDEDVNKHTVGVQYHFAW